MFTDPSEAPNGILNTRRFGPAPQNPDPEEEIEVYTDGSCHGNGAADAKCGSGIWYGQDDDRNTSTKVGPPLPLTNNTGELIAVLESIQQNKSAKRLKIASDSQYTIEALTKHSQTWLSKGLIGVKNPEIVSAILGEILATSTEVRLRKVKGHSGDTGNDGADMLANAGANKTVPDKIDLTMSGVIRAMGAKTNSLTQAQAYRLMMRHKAVGERTRTTRMMTRTRAAIEASTGVDLPPETVWKSLRIRKKGTISQKFSVFAWKSLHEGHKIGVFWKHFKPERLICQPCNAPIEDLNHILTECRTSGQETIWKLAQRAWGATGLPWPEISLERILGVGNIVVKNDQGKVLEGRTRLLRIIVSESAYLAWLDRCEWRIGREQNPLRLHTKKEITAQWKSIIGRRFRIDWALTNKAAFGKRALRHAEVKRTWKGLTMANNDKMLRDDIFAEGVLVGNGGRACQRRPPGRNR
ncbi:ribonuclease H-like domain-containing protein [Ephemerocybe angulata]|uniref:ribonuclease H n=1 Tax=Ephemerocybe angulata TaxID=980116 RepID=A0A8H6M466_9AGAR|nr:ribonuclease H-like domain-containing protein [Tulosesus angulatus]